MPTSYTPNKSLQLQATGEDTGTWGINLNSNFSNIDLALGGTLNLSVAGSSNVNLSAAQAEYLIQNYTGVLTGNITVNFPASGGLYFVENNTTGAFTLTVNITGGSGSGIVVPQGQSLPVAVDATNLVVNALRGTDYSYVATATGGTNTAYTISQTYPSQFTLSSGTFITFTPSLTSGNSPTLNINGTGAIALQKGTPAGLVNIVAGDLDAGSPWICQYSSAFNVWIVLNKLFTGSITSRSTGFTLTSANIFVPIIATSAITVTLSAASTFPNYGWNTFFAQGGNIIFTPNGTDNINGVNASYTLLQGNSASIYVDGVSNWWIYTNNNAVTQSINDNSTKIATTAYTLAALQSTFYSLGGFVNKLRNNTLQVWQRGTSGTNPIGIAYIADGWQLQSGGASNAWTQITNTGTNSPKYALKINGNTGNTATVLYRKVESIDAAVMQGNQVTYQITIANQSGATLTPTVTLYSATASDNFTGLNTIAAYNSQSIANGSQGTICYTFTASTAYNGLMIVVNFGASLNNPANYIDIINDDFRITPGVASGANNANLPTVEYLGSAAEVARNQRYYWATTMFFNQNITVTYTMPVAMRATPTIAGAATSLAGYTISVNNGSIYAAVITAISQAAAITFSAEL